MSKIIFKTRPLYLKDIKYKNYYLIDLSNNKIILSLESLHDKNNNKNPVLKISDQTKLWDELIFHCHNLKNDYIKKNNMTFNITNYQNFFVKIEYKVTYPRRNFIIKFLPLFKGICIIHEYILLKLSTFEPEDKKAYNEENIIYGYDDNNMFKNSDNRYFENEHYLLKQVHLFILESLFCSNCSLLSFFSIARKPKIYFSEEILEIIDSEVNNYIRNSNNEIIYNDNNYLNEIINIIMTRLYDEYIKINNNEKDMHNPSSNILQNKNSLISKEIKLLDKNKLIKITKNETLIFLFNYNKNIDPNDITLDLNDERLSFLKMTTHMENDDNSSIRISKSINKKYRSNSIRISKLLEEKNSNRPSKETMDNKFPHDTDEKGRENNYDDNSNNYSNIKLIVKNNKINFNNYIDNNKNPEPQDTEYIDNYDKEYSNNNNIVDLSNNNSKNDSENNNNDEFNDDNGE